MKILPGVVTRPSDVFGSDRLYEEGSLQHASLKLNTSRIVDAVQKQVKNALTQLIGPAPENIVQSTVQHALYVLRVQDVIAGWSGLDVTVGPARPLQEVDTLPHTARPGDAFVVNVEGPDGARKDEYRGIVLSADGAGHGSVLQALDVPGQEITARVNISLNSPLRSIAIEVRHLS